MESTVTPNQQPSPPGTTNAVQQIRPNSAPISADYAALGVTSGYCPPSAKKVRLYLLGPSGGGKSSFIAGQARTLILDFDDGANSVPNGLAHRIHINSIDKLEVVITKLEADAKAGKPQYDRVVWDTFDWYLDLLNPYLAVKHSDAAKGIILEDITDYGSKGAGWSILRVAAWNYVLRVEHAGYGWTCVSHLTEKTITENYKEKTVIRPVLSASIHQQIGRSCHIVANIYPMIVREQQTRLVGGKQVPCEFKELIKYFMVFQNTENFSSMNGGKARGIPPLQGKILLPDPYSDSVTSGWDTFEKIYSEAVERVRAKLVS